LDHGVVELQTFRPDFLPGLVEIWNESFSHRPNFVRLREEDFRRHVVGQPLFDGENMVVAIGSGRPLGFVHFGPRVNSWSDVGTPAKAPAEGQIYVVVAPRSDPGMARDLLAAATQQLKQNGAKRLLLGPSWLHGTQPFYNCIAGAYEFPGLDAGWQVLLELAGEVGFVQVAEYGTPWLDLSQEQHVAALDEEADRLWRRAQQWGLEGRRRPVPSPFFPKRASVELTAGGDVIAMTAYGLWPQYAREYGRRVFGLTSVHVWPAWRGRGLGKLTVMMAMQAAREQGAQALHLHVWRGNKVAWNLYHRAMGFQPQSSWVTLAKRTA
jgi:ribosomal protein S18 acetylase RimI-like enzyme